MLDIQLVLSILLSQILEIELCLVLHGSAGQEFDKIIMVIKVVSGISLHRVTSPAPIGTIYELIIYALFPT